MTEYVSMEGVCSCGSHVKEKFPKEAIRPVKTKLKVSGQFKTMEGAEAYANLHSITQTARKNGQNPFSALQTVAQLMAE